MSGKEQQNRIFVGGLSRDITERELEDAFSRFGKVIDCQVMLERDSGRPRGFGFLTFTDRRAVQDAIRDMHGREFGDRVISVNKAQPKLADEDPDHGYGGYSSGGRGTYGGDRSAGQDNCFKCGRPGHWARDCTSAGGGRGGRPFSPPRSRYSGGGGRGDRYVADRDRYMDDRYDKGRYDSRDDRFASRDRYPPAGDRFTSDRYGNSDRYPQNGHGKDRAYDRDGGAGGARGGNDRYGGGGPARYEGRNNRDRAGPYDRPRRGGRPSFELY